jgi:hypothetical protein
MATKQQQQNDAQLEVAGGGEVFEVLSEAPNGHRTVRRVRAKDRAAAEKQVAADLAAGQVIGTSVAGAGLGSGDAA